MNKIVPLPRKNYREKVYNMVIHVRKLPFGGDFLAINLCGLIFAVRDLSPEELNHERIHTAQQRELLFLPFFLWYAAEWLVLMVRYRNSMEAYYRIRFEREAYRHQAESDYLARRKKIHPPVILSSQNNGRMSLGYAVQRRMILYFTRCFWPFWMTRPL